MCLTKDDVNIGLSYDDISTRTRRKLDDQQKPCDRDINGVAVNEIKIFLLPKLLFIFN